MVGTSACYCVSDFGVKRRVVYPIVIVLGRSWHYALALFFLVEETLVWYVVIKYAAVGIHLVWIDLYILRINLQIAAGWVFPYRVFYVIFLEADIRDFPLVNSRGLTGRVAAAQGITYFCCQIADTGSQVSIILNQIGFHFILDF